MYAVIRTGGKQYRVSKGDVLEIERLKGAAGDAVTFDEVLLVGDDGDTKVGRPIVDGAAVKGEIVDQFRGRKIIVFKMKRRKNYRRKQGHRQDLTRVRITDIATSGGATGGGAKAAAPKKAAPKTAKPGEKPPVQTSGDVPPPPPKPESSEG